MYSGSELSQNGSNLLSAFVGLSSSSSRNQPGVWKSLWCLRLTPRYEISVNYSYGADNFSITAPPTVFLCKIEKEQQDGMVSVPPESGVFLNLKDLHNLRVFLTKHRCDSSQGVVMRRLLVSK